MNSIAKGWRKRQIKEHAQQQPEWYHTKNIYGCDVFYHRSEERGYMSGKITPLYTHPPVPYVVEPRTAQPKEPEQRNASEHLEPVAFLANGARFKLTFDAKGRVSSLWHNMQELDGRWVALVAAEDDCHLNLTTTPQRKPLTDEQADSIINGLRTCLHLDSKRMFVKTWLRDWAAHGISTWVGLTNEEELQLAGMTDKSRHWLVAAVEAKLKEKNNGT